MSDLREKLAAVFLRAWFGVPHAAEFAADRLARLVEGGWIKHSGPCCGFFDAPWRPGDESTCTCGLAEALGMRKEK